LKNISDTDTASKLSGYQEDVTAPLQDGNRGNDAVLRAFDYTSDSDDDEDLNILNSVGLALAKVSTLISLMCIYILNIFSYGKSFELYDLVLNVACHGITWLKL
jgi:hypothetical protein